MADESKSIGNVSNTDVTLNFTEMILCDLCEALMDAPRSEKCLISRLKRIGIDAKEEYMNIKVAFKDKGQDQKTTKGTRHNPPSRAESAARRKSMVSRLLLLGKKIMSEYSNSNDSVNDIEVVKLVLNCILEALMDTKQGKTLFQYCFQRFCQSDYFNSKQATTTQTARGTSKSSDSINVADLVHCNVWLDLMNKPQGEEHYLSRLQRISREAIIEHRNITAANAPETEGNSQDCHAKASRQKAPTQTASASLTTKKSKATFGDICESLFVGCKLPGGLLLAQSIYCAKVALAFYNNKHSTEYKLIEPLASARYMDCGIRFHSNFTAAELKNGHYTGQPKLFYADFRCYKKKARDVHCCIINSGKATFVCCEYCSPDLAHCDKRSTHVLSDYDRHLSPMTLKARKNEFCAKTALNFYNEKHGTEYELVKSLESNIVPIKFGTYQFSCNFKAKLEEPGGADDASSKLFFGKMVMSTGRKDGECYIVDTAEGLDDRYYPNCEQDVVESDCYKTPSNPCDLLSGSATVCGEHVSSAFV